MNTKVDEYISKAQNWHDKLSKLRTIILDCGLTEDFKWRNPCYTYQKNNIALIAGSKEYCALSFFKGVLLKDTNNILVQPGENSQSVRLIKFTDIQEIEDLEAIVKNYIYEAIEVEKAGLRVDFKAKKALVIPEELQIKFDENHRFQFAFNKLSLGRQRGYILYFSGAKQSKTRASRIDKYTQQILNGKGFHDCTCGHSKKMPTCDGSHKYIQ